MSPWLPCAAMLVACSTWPLHAQLTDPTVRISPVAASYGVSDAAGRISVSQVAMPIFVAMPIGTRLSVDIGTAFASSSFSRGGTSRSLSGLTDVQLRSSFALTDRVVITFGVNAPTGDATVQQANLELAGMVGTDLLSLAVPAYGVGPAFTGGVAVGQTVGAWTLSGGISVRQATGFKPFDNQATRFVPGSEYRLSANGERDLAGGRLALGLTASAFGGVEFGTAATSTGSRYIAQGAWIGSLGDRKPDLVVSGWLLSAGAGQFNALPLPGQQLGNLQVALGFGAGRATVEPNLETRIWNGGTGRSGSITMLGLRTRIPVGAYTIYPGAAFGAGQMSHNLGVAAPFTGGLTGFRATVGMSRTF